MIVNWHPAPGSSLQLQFSRNFNLSVQADVYDLDLFDTTPDTVAEIHASGNRVICYIWVGAWEDWRPDADQFPEDVIGKDYQAGLAKNGWTSARLTNSPPCCVSDLTCVLQKVWTVWSRTTWKFSRTTAVSPLLPTNSSLLFGWQTRLTSTDLPLALKMPPTWLQMPCHISTFQWWRVLRLRMVCRPASLH